MQNPAAIAAAFGVAREHHRAGRLAEAEKIYAEILIAEPRHADALHLRGVLAGQTGRNDEAVRWLQESVAIRPDHAEAHKNLGVALKAAGRWDEAIASCRAAVALQPDYAEAFKNLAGALAQHGELDAAIAAYRHAIELRPDFAEAHSGLGVALQQSGRPGDAVAACRRAVALQPGDPHFQNNLGTALHASARHDDAIAAFRAALTLRSDFAPAHRNLGRALSSAERTDEALAAYQNAARVQPASADALADLAHALRDAGRNAEAIAALQTALALQPDAPAWRHLLAALSGDQSSATTPAEYVRQLFDPYAATFDEHLVRQLAYRVPELLLDAVRSIAPEKKFDVLDLGCGTGLCGAAFRSAAKKITGVDLSPGMIAQADARGIYDRLITGELTDVMREYADAFDLILAGDVFIYVGDLRHVLAAAARALCSGGLFAFSLERHDGDGFVLHAKIRFAHSLAYVRELAHTHGFTEVTAREITVRKSGADDVTGHIVVLQKSHVVSGASICSGKVVAVF